MRDQANCQGNSPGFESLTNISSEFLQCEFEDLGANFVCYSDEGCVLEVYSTPQENASAVPEVQELQDEVYVNINVEECPTLKDVSRRLGAANQVLPLLTSVYEDRSTEAATGGLSAEYRAALSGDSRDSRTCCVCAAVFLSPTKLLHHAETQHGLLQLKLQQCFVCRQTYVFPQTLVLHLREFHALPSPHLTCRVCYCQLSSRSELKAHTRKHELSEPCSLCFAHFPSKHQLTEHMDAQHAKPFPCRSCRQSFSNEAARVKHESRHKDMREFKCDCGFTAADNFGDSEWNVLQHLQICRPDTLRTIMALNEMEDVQESNFDTILTTYYLNSTSSQHDERVEKCVEDLVCAISSFYSGPTIVEDIETSQNSLDIIPELSCQLCSDQSKAVQCTSEVILQHLTSSHPRSKHCPLCRKRFSSSARARSHAQRHSKIIEASYLEPTNLTCQYCSRHFFSKGKLNWHLEYQHEMNIINKPHRCHLCPRKFLFATSRDKHVASHASSKNDTEGCKHPDVLCCQFCSSTFIKPSYLKKHEEKYHPQNEYGEVEESSFECNLCGDKLENLQKLRRHMVYKHGPAADKQRYQCPHCPVGCRTAVGLKVHLRVHTDERPHICSICSKGFKRKQALTVHLRSVHSISNTKLQLFQCTECNVRLEKKSAVTKHYLRVHRNLKRFICGLCGEKHCQNQELKQHMLSKHRSNAPSISTRNRQEQTHIYVFPAIDKLPPTHPHAILIAQVVDFEKSKTKDLPDFPLLQESNESVGESICDSENADDVKQIDGNPRISSEVEEKLPSDSIIQLTTIVNLESNTSMDLGNSVGLKQLVQDISGVPNTHLFTLCNPETQEQRPVINPCILEAAPNSNSSFEDNIYLSDIMNSNDCLNQMMSNDECNENVKSAIQPQQTVEKNPQSKKRRKKVGPKSNENNMQSFQPSDESVFKCNVCGKCFLDRQRLSRHNKVHTDLKEFTCNICEKSFHEKCNLIVHLRTHSGDRPYQCDQCGKAMRYHQELEDHLRIHRGERPYVCLLCPDISFVRVKDLRRHEKSRHQPRSAELECPVCHKSFCRKDALELHLRNVHVEKKQMFECNVCSHRFSTETLLQRHKILHTGSKNHVCTQCGKVFATKSYLRGHQKTHMRQISYLQCPLCPRRFSTNETLKIHQDIFHEKLTLQHNQIEEIDLATDDVPPASTTPLTSLVGELDLINLQLDPADDDIHIVYLQVLSDANLDDLPE